MKNLTDKNLTNKNLIAIFGLLTLLAVSAVSMPAQARTVDMDERVATVRAFLAQRPTQQEFKNAVDQSRLSDAEKKEINSRLDLSTYMPRVEINANEVTIKVDEYIDRDIRLKIIDADRNQVLVNGKPLNLNFETDIIGSLKKIDSVTTDPERERRKTRPYPGETGEAYENIPFPVSIAGVVAGYLMCQSQCKNDVMSSIIGR